MNEPIQNELEKHLGKYTNEAAGLLEIISNNFLEKEGGKISPAELEKLYAINYPSSQPHQILRELVEKGFIVEEKQGFFITSSLQGQVNNILSRLAGKMLNPFIANLSSEDLLDSFKKYTRREEPQLDWVKEIPGQLKMESGNKIHRIKASFTPFSSPPKPGQYNLMLGSWHEQSLPFITSYLVKKPWLKQVALYNLKTGTKINLVPTGIFTYFDWYLRDVYQVRIAPCQYFTRSLMKEGMMRFEG